MQVVDDFSRYYYSHPRHPSWMGKRVLKCVLDLWVYQEIIWEMKPDIIIESGTFYGGGTLYLAMICDMVGHGEVISIDISNKKKVPQHSRITYLIGSSISDEIVMEISKRISGKSVMVILDSEHTKSHVLKELEIYSKLVTEQNYLIVEDTNLNGHPISPEYGEGPMEAVMEFMEKNNDFTVDLDREKFHMTFNPNGYLRKNCIAI